MTRETVTTTRYSCERCRKSEVIDTGSVTTSDWSSLKFQTHGRGAIGGLYTLDNLCPACTDSFEEWMKNA